VEVVVPFASTLSSQLDSDVDGTLLTSRSTELGDVAITTKFLLFRSDNAGVAAGAAMTLPTSNDRQVSLADGTTLFRISSNSIHLQPYLAAAFAPSDRLFTQAFVQVDFDLNGSNVSTGVNLNPNFLPGSTPFVAPTGLQSIGRYTDQTFLFLDYQIGDWIYRSTCRDARIAGLAPFFEVHYNASISNADEFTTPVLSLGTLSGSVNSVNLATGLIVDLGARSNVLFGAVFPVTSGSNRGFDYELGIRANLYFGHTYSERSRFAETY
jgi:hypothetical protein